jgi:hypothetical protein
MSSRRVRFDRRAVSVRKRTVRRETRAAGTGPVRRADAAEQGQGASEVDGAAGVGVEVGSARQFVSGSVTVGWARS